MINVKINGTTVNLSSKLVYNNNRKEQANYGNMKVLNDREARYEPLSIVEFDDQVNFFQCLVESDTVLLLKNGLYEHEITLIETIAYFDKVFPVNRSFTTVEPKSIDDILTVYQTELAYYQDILIDWAPNSLFDTKMPYKEYKDASFSKILYDLFNRIDAIPRIEYDDGTWLITAELYITKNNPISLGVEHRQSQVNDVEYATAVLSRTRNAVSDDVWFPSAGGTVTPRIKGEMFQTSTLQYELDCDILEITQAIYPNLTVFASYYDNIAMDYVDREDTIDVDFTEAVLTEKEYLATKNFASGGTIANPIIGSTNYREDAVLYKQNTIYYTIEDNTIKSLFNVVNGILGFTVDINNLRNAIYQFVRICWLEQIAPTIPGFESLTSLDFTIETDVEDIGCRFKYRPKRDVDVIVEKSYQGDFNKSTILTAQKDSYIDLERFIENNQSIANRMGKEIKGISQNFLLTESYWKLGDYYGDWLIVDIRYTFDKNNVTCLADFAQDFANISKEYSIARQPSAFAYSGKRLTSNFILRYYVEFYTGTNLKPNSTTFNSTFKNTLVNIFGFSSTYNHSLNNILLTRYPNITNWINIPLLKSGNGILVFHAQLNDPRIAGNGMIKISSITQGTYAWYKSPAYYVQDDFSLQSVLFKLTNDFIPLTDTSTTRYYPLVEDEDNSYMTALEIPVDKNIDDSLALTVQVIPYSDNENIVIGPAFTKYNNLIREFETTPTLELYSSSSKYTLYDKKIRSGDVLNATGYTFSSYEITTPTLQYWALAYNGEIVVAGNNYTNSVKIKIDDRY